MLLVLFFFFFVSILAPKFSTRITNQMLQMESNWTQFAFVYGLNNRIFSCFEDFFNILNFIMKINVDALTVCDVSPSSLMNSALTHDHTNFNLWAKQAAVQPQAEATC